MLSSATGNGLAGVTVTAGGQTTTTASSGAYTLSGVGVDHAVVVKFALAGYAPGYRSVDVAANATTAAGARLTGIGSTQSIAASSGGTVTMPGSPAQVVLPANGLVNKATGAAASGQVTVEITPINPALEAANMPGSFSARGTDGSAQTIESFGAVSINLSDAAGNRLDLASGQTASLRIPLASRSSAPPTTIPLYYFDETAGLWVQQGAATLAGTAPNQYYEGAVSHFTYWNADQPTATIYVHGCVSEPSGTPSVGAMVSTDGMDYSGGSTGFTDTNGNFVVPIRKGGVASLWADSPNGTTNVVVVGPSDVDIYLPACLVVGPPGPPVIVEQPTPVSTQEGNAAIFKVVARGSQPLRYQWLRNGTPMPGQLVSQLLLYPASGADNGTKYSVVVANDYGAVTSDVVALTVAVVPPGLLGGPQSTAVTVGAVATFAVQTSQPASLLSFQWNVNGTPVVGATTSSFTTPATTIANNGDRYSVTITNSAGTVSSSEAVLTVQMPALPTFTQNPASISVTTGQSGVFQVQAAGSPPLSYQWSRNGTAIAAATGSSYTTPATVLGDNGAQYVVVVTNSVGSVTSAVATLSVADPSFAPTITQQPQATAKVTGQTATFSVTATGTVPLSYQWSRNGLEITGATSASYTTPVLALADNSASFSVRVTNAQGSVTSSVAVLTVTAAPVAPSITSQPQNVSVSSGLTASFSVTATGTSPLTYQWQRGGVAIGGATSATYTTPVLAVSDSGAVFTVVVTNTVNSVTSAGAMLTVTSSQSGAGRYLVAEAGPTTATAVVYANGSQTIDSQAILAASAVAPTTTSVVEPAGQATVLFGTVFAGTVANGQLTDLRTRYSLYFKGSNLYRIDQQPTSGAPQGVQLSTLAPSDVCSVGSAPDLANDFGSDLADPTRNWVFFAAPVAGTCTSPSNSYKAVRMNMGSNDAPLTIGEPVATLYDNSAAITGYILRNGSSFQRVDANLANPATLFTLAPSAFHSYGVSFGATTPGVWMFFNGGQLYAYDLATAAGSPTVVTSLSTEQVGSIVSDGMNAYVSIKAAGFAPGFRIVRVTDTLTVAPVYSSTTASLIEFSLTPTRIVMVSSTPSNAGLSTGVTSVLRDGTALLDIGSANDGFFTVFAYTAGENVYLYEFGLNGSGVQTGVRTRIITSDGSNAQTLANTALVGVVPSASLPLVHTLTGSPYALLLVDNVAADGTSSAGTLHSLVGATRAPLLSYGTIQATPPASFYPATVDPLQYGQPGLFAFTPAGSSAAGDLYFIDSDTANSLTKVTTFVTASGTSSPAAVVRGPGRRSAKVLVAPANRRVGSMPNPVPGR